MESEPLHSVRFPTSEKEVWERINLLNPFKYSRTRNYINGSVSYLSPYLSRGFISTKQVFEYLLSLNLPWRQIEKLVQELAWRDFMQQVWRFKGNLINEDLNNPQSPVSNYGVPEVILSANSGIIAIDKAIQSLFDTGYMHNHLRMYLASLCCNIANYHWFEPSKWLYANLLDGDIGSNQLNWQWIAGTFSKKKYYANQWNINKYALTDQKGSFLDVDYEDISSVNEPINFKKKGAFHLETPLPKFKYGNINRGKTTLIYNYYNLDPSWYKDSDYQRILLLEPSVFAEFPVEQKCIDFVIGLAKNIKGIKFFVGEFRELESIINVDKVIYKEHPLNSHYKGKEEPRDWMFNVQGFYPSFFSFWKKCKKELKHQNRILI